MQRYVRPAASLGLAAVAAFAIAACGSGSSNNKSGGGGSGSSSATSTQSGGGGGTSGGTITIASGTAPTSADPGLDFTTQGNELYSVINVPLLTFTHNANGDGSAKLQPALAAAMPTITGGGKIYTFTLRKGLKYSNGKPIKASDELRTLERDVKIPWLESSFITGYIQGADAYAKNKAKTISGVVTNDKKGTIAIHLTSQFHPIIDIFGLPGTAPVPAGTPQKNQASTGVPGDGPYKWGSISPGRQYTLVRNPSFNGVPTVPKGYADKIVENDNSNVLADAQQVLNNQADVFDPGDTIPASILPQIKAKASSRFQAVPTNSSYWFFFGVNQKPFNNLYARQAVQAAMDDRTFAREDSGFISPDCHLIPPGIIGHSTPSNCPFHDVNGAANMAKAKALMKKSGMIGQPVTVWGEERSPRKQWTDSYTQILNQLGFKATEKIINSDTYFTTIGTKGTDAQTGFADWVADFPDPWDFAQLFTTVAAPGNNYGYVSNKQYDSTLAKLYTQAPEKVAPQWAAEDDLLVKNAYFAAFGHEEFPKFYSDRLNFSKGVLSYQYETDLLSLQLNQ